MGHDVRMLCFLFAALDVFGEYGGFVVVHGYREAAPEVGVLHHGGRRVMWWVEDGGRGCLCSLASEG